ncbi:MAG TPA: hypothetical protein VGB88_07725 [Alphaproteobacteria bacterium]
MTRASSRLGALAVVLAAAAAPAPAVAAEVAWTDDLPYGLAWGMTLKQVLDAGIRVEYGKLQGEFGHEYLAFDLPPQLGDEDQVFLYFGYDDRLWRIAVHSRGYSDEGTGTALVKRYDELKAALDARYGAGEEFLHLHDSAVAVPKRTVGTIQIGASWRFTEYRTPGEHIQLGIRARNLWTGYIALYIKNLDMEPKAIADAEANAKTVAAGEETPFPAPHLSLEQDTD